MQAQKIPIRHRRDLENPSRFIEKQQTQEKPSKVKAKLAFCAILLVCFALSVATVVIYSKVVMTNFEITNAEKEVDHLLAEQRELELIEADLSCLGRIENIARTQLGMKEAKELNIQTVSQDDFLEAQ